MNAKTKQKDWKVATPRIWRAKRVEYITSRIWDAKRMESSPSVIWGAWERKVALPRL